MSTDPPLTHQLIDPATGRQVIVVYAFPPGMAMPDQPVDGGTSPAELLGRILAKWRLVTATTVLGAAIGLKIALTTPNIYTASATALPPPDKGGGGMMAQYAGLAVAAGMSLPSAPTSNTDSIMAILASRRLQEPLIERFGLRAYYQVTTRDDALHAFAANFSARLDKKSNTIAITCTNREPQKASDIANAAASDLRVIFNQINQGTASRERDFLERRLAATEIELATAAKALADFQSQHNAISIESQTKATIEAIAKLQGELIGQQIELRALLASQASPDNPRVQLLQERVNAMGTEMQRLLGGEKNEGPGVLLGLASLPELGIAYVERYRMVKKCEAVLAALTTQLEAARINEVRQAEVVNIIDQAYPPERKAGPARAQICMTATMLGGLLGIALALLPPLSLFSRLRPVRSETQP